ncbi:hypothetical protein [Halobacillus salinus]|nr:hypothetical protein [Halobacillus salinus]
MSKNSKSKRNLQKSRDAVQPANGKERTTISKTNKMFDNEQK